VGGDRYELWQSRTCDTSAPCVDSGLLVMRWRGDTVPDAREFETALKATAVGRSGGVTVAWDGGDTVTLVVAPTPELGARVR
jgi:hypothetical protein